MVMSLDHVAYYIIHPLGLADLLTCFYHLNGSEALSLYLAPGCDVGGCVWRQLPNNLSTAKETFIGN